MILKMVKTVNLSMATFLAIFGEYRHPSLFGEGVGVTCITCMKAVKVLKARGTGASS